MKGIRKWIRISCVTLAVFMLVGTLAACKSKRSSSELNETTPLRIAIQNADKVFNPFFSTSGVDSEIIGQTQIGMLSSDEKGNYVYGDDYPSVVKDMTIVMKDKNGNVSATGDKDGTTEYEFLLKNDIQFSDGIRLTMKDVLFNLYVYLDPVYTGSATLYSTDIVGLTDYRTQTLGADSSVESANETKFGNEATTRIQEMINYGRYLGNVEGYTTVPDADGIAKIWEDVAAFNKLFDEEINADFRNSQEILSEYQKETNFEYDYQLYMYMWGMLSLQRDNVTGFPLKGDDGRYMMDTSDAAALVTDCTAYENENYAALMTDGVSEADARAAARQAFSVKRVYDYYTINKDLTAEDGLAMRAKNFAGTHDRYAPSIVVSCASYSDLHSMFKAEQRAAYYKDILNADGSLKIPTITGIDGSAVVKSFNGKNLKEDHELLRIRINGVDPKAIWNFAFTVAPMHYYSDYASQANKTDNFGVKYCTPEFMTSLKKDNRISVPMGAGPYKASTAKGLSSGQKVNGNEFFSHNVVYYERNTYFETVGKNVQNAKIKYLRYQVINTDQVINALRQNEIDAGEPSATKANRDTVGGISHLESVEIRTNGYGYVGINPRFIPNIWERRAIMCAMDTRSIVSNYYTGGLAQTIYRPMSMESWAYPSGAEVYKNASEGLDYTYDDGGARILSMLTAVGYSQTTVGGQKTLLNPDGKKLEYTFTIAGETEDHPAWNMFEKARDILNGLGFKITIRKDATALTKLASGDLTVWAAAWSSTIDPDMYQVYHKDSQATSVKNWGYTYILNDTTDKYATERDIINRLSLKIEEGRSTIVQSERKEIYSNALDLVMELAVELPTYQRSDMTVYNKNRIKESSLMPKAKRSAYNGLFSNIWEVEFN